MVVSRQLTDTYRALQREAEGYVLLMQVGAFMPVARMERSGIRERSL